MSILNKLLGKDPEKNNVKRENRKARQSARRERTKQKREKRAASHVQKQHGTVNEKKQTDEK